MSVTTALLVEDAARDDAIADVVRGWDGAFRVECVDRLSTALVRLNDGGIDLVLLDLELPDSTGPQTYLRIRDAAPDTPVLILTTADGDDEALDALELGLHDYLTREQVSEAAVDHAMCYLIERRSMTETLNGQLLRQQAVVDLGSRALEGVQVDELLQEAADVVARVLDVELTGVLELSADGTLRLTAGTGWQPGLVGRAVVPGDSGSLAGFTVLAGEAVIVDDIVGEARFEPPDLLTVNGVVSGVSVRIHESGTPFGILGAYTTSRRTFLEQDVQFMRGMAHVIGQAVARKHSEEKLARLNRLYAVVVATNQSITHAHDRNHLFQDVCRIATSRGGFRMVWVGLVDEPSGLVRPVAHSGFEEGYLGQVTNSTGDGPEGRGAVGTAIRESRNVVINSVADDPALLPWREPMLRRGYLSVGAFPLRIGSDVIGILVAYATEPSFFNADETSLLDSLAADVSLALESMAIQETQLAADAAMRAAESRYSSIFENAAEGIFQSTLDGEPLLANPACARMLGYDSPEDLVASTAHADNLYVDPADRKQLIRLIEESVSVTGFEVEMRCRDGSTLWASMSARALRDAQGQMTGLEWMAVDFTKQRRATQDLAERIKELTSLLAVSREVQTHTSVETLCRSALGHLASGMQFPDAAAPVIVVNEDVFGHERWQRALTNGLHAPITVYGEPQGWVRMFYTGDQPFLLPEEQALVTSVAAMIGGWLERSRAVEALRDSEERFRLSIDNMIDPFEIYSAVRDPARRIVDFRLEHANQAALAASVPAGSPVGMTLLDQFPSLGRLGILDTYIRLVETQAPVSVDDFDCQDGLGGDRRMVDIRAVPLNDGYAVTWRDTTQRVEAKEALERRDAILETVASATEQMLRAQSWQESIQTFLNSLVRVTGVTRAQLFYAGSHAEGIARVDLVAEATGPATEPTEPEPPSKDVAYLQAGLDRWREVMRTGRAVHGIASQMPERERAFLESQGNLAVALFPILAANQGWGVLAFNDCELERKWSEPELDALRVAADTIGAAIQREAAERAEVALRTSEERFRLLAENAQDLIYRYRYLPTPAFEYVSPSATVMTGFTPDELYRDPDLGKKIIHPEDRPLLEKVMKAGQTTFAEPLVLRCVRKDGSVIWTEHRNSPVLDANGNLIGVDGIARDITERKAAENALSDSFDMLRRSDAERRRLVAHLITVQEEERKTIASDIHDDSIQVLTALGIRLQTFRRKLTDPAQLEALSKLEEIAQQAVVRLRHLMFELRPPALDRDGLGPALRSHLSQIQDDTGIEYELHDRLSTDPPTELRPTIYRIAQEAIANVRKHAQSPRVEVVLESRDAGTFMSITDDGVGFAPTEIESRKGHLGMTSMRERANLAGGWTRFHAEPGSGTRVEVWVPHEVATVPDKADTS